MLGPRQTGKTTLLQRQISSDGYINFADPELRLHYEMSPNLLKAEINAIVPNKSRKIPLIILDEIQKVPELMDLIQILIDSKQAQFILTGSFTRKLRRHNQDINLLAGRVVMLHLDPLSLLEIPADKPGMLESLLTYGSLPGIFLQTDNQDKETDLKSYVISYLEEEVRAEALVRNIGAFARFLEHAALELGFL